MGNNICILQHTYASYNRHKYKISCCEMSTYISPKYESMIMFDKFVINKKD
jgi:hypothetical protein